MSREPCCWFSHPRGPSVLPGRSVSRARPHAANAAFGSLVFRACGTCANRADVVPSPGRKLNNRQSARRSYQRRRDRAQRLEAVRSCIQPAEPSVVAARRCASRPSLTVRPAVRRKTTTSAWHCNS